MGGAEAGTGQKRARGSGETGAGASEGAKPGHGWRGRRCPGEGRPLGVGRGPAERSCPAEPGTRLTPTTVRRGGHTHWEGARQGARAAASRPTPTAAAEERSGRRREARAHLSPPPRFFAPGGRRRLAAASGARSSLLTQSRLHLVPTPPVPGRATTTAVACRERACPKPTTRPHHRRPAPRNRGSARPAPPSTSRQANQNGAARVSATEDRQWAASTWGS